MSDKKVRVSFYVDEQQYLILRSYLVMQKRTVSEWLRERVKRFVETKEQDNG